MNAFTAGDLRLLEAKAHIAQPGDCIRSTHPGLEYVDASPERWRILAAKVASQLTEELTHETSKS
jgi:hypothetical protein